ncbi:GNAT family N-acetyltransferase [Soonwooa purpurea]
MKPMNVFPKLKTKRLVMNAYKPTDAEVVFFLRSSPEVTKYIKRDPYTSIEQAEDFIKMISHQFENDLSITWALRFEEEGDLLGSICFWNFSEDRKTAEIGYDLQPIHQGKGYMTEALNAIIKYGREELKLNLIEAFTSTYNEASIKLLTNNDFVLNQLRHDDDNLDNLIFEMKIP